MSVPNQRKLVVSFHDLHPGTKECCARFLHRLEALGVPRASLLAVPNWYGEGGFDAHPEFCAWLREQPHDLSLHGWTHRAAHTPGRPMEWLVANHYTAGEGEFYRLPAAEAQGLVARGLEVFERAGVRPGGFVAPAWLMESDLLPVLKRAGLGYAVTLNKLFDLPRGTFVRAPVLCPTSRTPVRRALTRQVVCALAKRHAREPLLRIAVHPVDFRHPQIAGFVYRLIAEALETRQATTYAELVD